MTSARYRYFVVPVAVALLCVSACSKKMPNGELILRSTLRGKVTWKGESVPYGYVVLYLPDKSLDPKTGKTMPLASGAIGKNGEYEVNDAPTGHVVVCVVTDPDIPPHEVMRPGSIAGGMPGFPGGPPGGPPGMPGAPPGGPPGGPPGAPPGGPPGEPGGKPAGPAEETARSFARDLSDDQKQMLKAIHKKYGAFVMSPLRYDLVEGDQTIHLELK